MKKLSIDECRRDLLALDAADQLAASVESEVAKFKDMDMQELIKKATKMFFSGNVSPEAIGLSENFFEKLEHLTRLNAVARLKYRECVQSDLDELSLIQDFDMEDGEVVNE
ncbi:hypothetical protein M9194_11730 [Vibrio sp. S4M6]|uniref:hypothetical protein n=1 Tax=Vibrio sinus TaxID=2946865 RepID=UPI00202AA7A9|nr:hypothetical protein [Vibrio sinus]MCL9782097.1 hypothetical protein [Vibrio sinus]